MCDVHFIYICVCVLLGQPRWLGDDTLYGEQGGQSAPGFKSSFSGNSMIPHLQRSDWHLNGYRHGNEANGGGGGSAGDNNPNHSGGDSYLDSDEVNYGSIAGSLTFNRAANVMLPPKLNANLNYSDPSPSVGGDRGTIAQRSDPNTGGGEAGVHGHKSQNDVDAMLDLTDVEDSYRVPDPDRAQFNDFTANMTMDYATN